MLLPRRQDTDGHHTIFLHAMIHCQHKGRSSVSVGNHSNSGCHNNLKKFIFNFTLTLDDSDCCLEVCYRRDIRIWTFSVTLVCLQPLGHCILQLSLMFSKPCVDRQRQLLVSQIWVGIASKFFEIKVLDLRNLADFLFLGWVLDKLGRYKHSFTRLINHSRVLPESL